MAVLNVNPTRNELNNLKKKLAAARHGHKLLKDKSNELYRQLIKVTNDYNKLKSYVSEKISEAEQFMFLAKQEMSKEEIAVALLCSFNEAEIRTFEKNIVGVRVPVYELVNSMKNTADTFSYGLAFTSFALDEYVKIYKDITSDILRLAELKNSCIILTDETVKIKRRVNALENVTIKDCEDTVKYISSKLAENERSANAALMKVKDITLQRAHNYI